MMVVSTVIILILEIDLVPVVVVVGVADVGGVDDGGQVHARHQAVVGVVAHRAQDRGRRILLLLAPLQIIRGHSYQA